MSSLKRWAKSAAVRPALALAAIGMTPNMLTLAGSLLTASVGLLAAQGWFVAAGICYAVFALMDTLDGALARATNRVTSFGAFLDSVCDRYAEAAVFLGIAWWYQQAGDSLGLLLTLLALVGSLMVSYARARAEGLDYHAEVGWFQRPERIALTSAGLVLAQFFPFALLAVLGVLAVLTNFTVLQRMVHVAGLSEQRD